MKRLLIYLTILFIISSCQPSTFYQLYNVESSQKTIKKSESSFEYENKYCKISYNFWSVSGNVGFVFHNKTSKSITLNLDECFFIKNGFAEDYYQNRIFTNTKGSQISQSNSSGASKQITGFNLAGYLQTNGASASNTATGTLKSENSISYEERPKITIPPSSSKYVIGFTFNDKSIRDCDLIRYPKSKSNSSVNFSEKNSPLNFKNIICYTVGDKKVTTKNQFYVSNVTNYPSSSFYYYKNPEFCGEKSYAQKKFFKFYDLNKFYVKYSKIDGGYVKH
tara:strand:+ start:378 stop:1214 length:837 start_codon:yes stop_codon:yes gene_type:complete